MYVTDVAARPRHSAVRWYPRRRGPPARPRRSIVADDEGDSKRLYERLGFAPVWLQHVFTAGGLDDVVRQRAAQWQDGLRRLAEAPADEQRMLERVTRRSRPSCAAGSAGAFTTGELADLYDQGTDWVTDLAVRVAPEDPYAWDVRTVGDAAFGRYLRSATDYAGGRRLRCEG